MAASLYSYSESKSTLVVTVLTILDINYLKEIERSLSLIEVSDDALLSEVPLKYLYQISHIVDYLVSNVKPKPINSFLIKSAIEESIYFTRTYNSNKAIKILRTYPLEYCHLYSNTMDTIASQAFYYRDLDKVESKIAWALAKLLHIELKISHDNFINTILSHR